MKRILSLITSLLVLGTVIACGGNDIVIQESQLPAAARELVRQHFGTRKIVLAKRETELLSKSYEVFLDNGDKIEFDGKGDWTEIDCGHSSVPAALVPAAIMQQVSKSYPGTSVLQIERDRKKYEVKLSNRMELKFDQRHRLTDIDM